MKIAIIDDSKYKIDALQIFLDEHWPDVELLFARSFQGGLSLIEESEPDLVLMDMTLPTSERSDGRLEGRTRIYGGKELMAEMDLFDFAPSVIVVTQFDQFQEQGSTIESKALFDRLHEEFPEIFLGGVFYSATDSFWVKDLKRLIEEKVANL